MTRPTLVQVKYSFEGEKFLTTKEGGFYGMSSHVSRDGERQLNLETVWSHRPDEGDTIVEDYHLKTVFHLIEKKHGANWREVWLND